MKQNNNNNKLQSQAGQNSQSNASGNAANNSASLQTKQANASSNAAQMKNQGAEASKQNQNQNRNQTQNQAQSKNLANSGKQTAFSNQAIRIPRFIAFESEVGALIGLISKSENHKNLFISDLEWLISPAVALKQFLLFRDKNNKPIACVTWANINQDVENRIIQNRAIRLSPNEWNCGNRLWIVDIVSPFVKTSEIVEQLMKSNQFKNKQPKILYNDKENNQVIGASLTDVMQRYNAGRNNNNSNNATKNNAADNSKANSKNKENTQN